MNRDKMRRRTKAFALEVLKLADSLPRGRSSEIAGRQLVRCSTSVGANYRAACRARSRADFISKLGIVLEEADESLYWLEILSESGICSSAMVPALMAEAKELVAIISASLTTARSKPSAKSQIANSKS